MEVAWREEAPEGNVHNSDLKGSITLALEIVDVYRNPLHSFTLLAFEKQELNLTWYILALG